MTRTILTFGDSNTHGTPPMQSHDHHPRMTRRWPTVLRKSLDCNVIEEGLGGRLAAGHGDPVMGEHMNGQIGLRIAIASHGPIDWMTIMLGTNDLQAHHGKTAAQIAAHVDALLKIALLEELQARHDGFQILLICPPPVIAAGVFKADFADQIDTSHALAPLYAAKANKRGVHFSNAGDHITSSNIDGIHFDQTAHDALGIAVADYIARHDTL